MSPVLELNDLTVELSLAGQVVRPVEEVSLVVEQGMVLALIGESGSGKTMTALATMGLLPEAGRVAGGEIVIDGKSATNLPAADRRRLRAVSMGMVFQDPLSSLNPVYSVGWQIAELFRVHEGASRREANERAVDLLGVVGIPDPQRRAREYPHQLSGGMRQRVMIAIAIALHPKLLIADEPTTALDVTIQAQILELLDELRREQNMAVWLITHDLGVVASLADEVVLMYAGRTVESAPAASFFSDPRHPYGQALRTSVPRLSQPIGDLEPVTGSPPPVAAFPDGCRFHPRCPYAIDRCRSELPLLRPVDDVLVACHRAEEIHG
jgi:oligopeptide transport system ATP-binding protein